MCIQDTITFTCTLFMIMMMSNEKLDKCCVCYETDTEVSSDNHKDNCTVLHHII